jgi:hypothetical protein
VSAEHPVTALCAGATDSGRWRWRLVGGRGTWELQPAARCSRAAGSGCVWLCLAVFGCADSRDNAGRARGSHRAPTTSAMSATSLLSQQPDASLAVVTVVTVVTHLPIHCTDCTDCTDCSDCSHSADSRLQTASLPVRSTGAWKLLHCCPRQAARPALFRCCVQSGCPSLLPRHNSYVLYRHAVVATGTACQRPLLALRPSLPSGTIKLPRHPRRTAKTATSTKPIVVLSSSCSFPVRNRPAGASPDR